MKSQLKKKSTSVISSTREGLPLRRSARVANQQANLDAKTTKHVSLLEFSAQPVTGESCPLHEIRDFTLPSPLKHSTRSDNDNNSVDAHAIIQCKSPLDYNSPDLPHNDNNTGSNVHGIKSITPAVVNCFPGRHLFIHQNRIPNPSITVTPTNKERLNTPKASDKKAWSDINT